MSFAASPRILMVSFLTPPYAFSGAGNQAVLLGNTLIEQGCSVALVTSMGERGWVKQVFLDRLPVFRLRGSRHKVFNAVLFNVLSLAWWTRHAHQFDVVHIHGCTNLFTLIWVLLAKGWGKKALLKIACSGVDDLQSIKLFPVIGPLAYHIARRADGFVAVTPEIAGHLKQSVPDPKIFQVNNGYDATLFQRVPSEKKAALRQELGLPENGTILLYMGTMNPRKEILFLLESFARVHKGYPDTTLCLVGPCKAKFQQYGQRVQSRIKELGLQGAVILRDTVPYETVAWYLQASDIFVFASRQEGLPSSPIEAMSCGLPIVMVTLPGVTDWLYEDDLEAKVVGRDTREFANAVAVMLENPAQKAKMSERAALAARQRFTMAAIANQYRETLYPILHEGRKEKPGTLGQEVKLNPTESERKKF